VVGGEVDRLLACECSPHRDFYVLPPGFRSWIEIRGQCGVSATTDQKIGDGSRPLFGGPTNSFQGTAE